MSAPDDDGDLGGARGILTHCEVSTDRIDDLLKDLDTELRRLQDVGSPEHRLINDAIHGPVELTPLAFKIINTPEFHRLKDIKQLGGSNYVYPGANHTRFDHSIGVYHLAGEFAKHLQKQLLQLNAPEEEKDLWKFSDKEVLCVEIAGLCHDLGHGPMSHMFERHVLKQLTGKKHEVFSTKAFKRLLTNITVLAEFVREGLGVTELKLIELMIEPNKEKKLEKPWKSREFLCEIVANKHSGMDVDKWDYYSRDCHYLGLTNDFQQKRCMLLGRIVKTKAEDSGPDELHVAFRDKELDNIYGMFRTRGILHQKAYQHKTVKAVERMIADAVMTVKDIKLLSTIDESESGEPCKKYVAKSVKTAIADADSGNNMAAYLALTDSLLGIIKYSSLNLSPNPIPTESALQPKVVANADSEEREKALLEEAKDLLRRVEIRDLYSCCGKIRIPITEPLWKAMQTLKVQPRVKTYINI